MTFEEFKTRFKTPENVFNAIKVICYTHREVVLPENTDPSVIKETQSILNFVSDNLKKNLDSLELNAPIEYHAVDWKVDLSSPSIYTLGFKNNSLFFNNLPFHDIKKNTSALFKYLPGTKQEPWAFVEDYFNKNGMNHWEGVEKIKDLSFSSQLNDFGVTAFTWADFNLRNKQNALKEFIDLSKKLKNFSGIKAFDIGRGNCAYFLGPQNTTSSGSFNQLGLDTNLIVINKFNLEVLSHEWFHLTDASIYMNHIGHYGYASQVHKTNDPKFSKFIELVEHIKHDLKTEIKNTDIVFLETVFKQHKNLFLEKCKTKGIMLDKKFLADDTKMLNFVKENDKLKISDTDKEIIRAYMAILITENQLLKNIKQTQLKEFSLFKSFYEKADAVNFSMNTSAIVTPGYFGSPLEIMARSFASFIVDKDNSVDLENSFFNVITQDERRDNTSLWMGFLSELRELMDQNKGSIKNTNKSYFYSSFDEQFKKPKKKKLTKY